MLKTYADGAAMIAGAATMVFAGAAATSVCAACESVRSVCVPSEVVKSVCAGVGTIF